MSPIKPETIVQAHLHYGKRQHLKPIIVAEGDEQHLGTWRFETNVLHPTGTSKLKLGENRIVDVAVDTHTLQVKEEIVPVESRYTHREHRFRPRPERKVVGVWSRVDPEELSLCSPYEPVRKRSALRQPISPPKNLLG